MIQLIKYRFLTYLKQPGTLFWPLVFPLILCTLFYISFGINPRVNVGDIQVAYVKTNDSQTAQSYVAYLEEVERGEGLISAEEMSQEEALEALETEKVAGIYYIGEKVTLSVGKTGVEQSILEVLLSSYEQNAKIIENIVKTYPENLQKAVEQMGVYENRTTEVSLGGRSLESALTYYFALIGMACLYGSFMGMESAFGLKANLSPLAARRSVSPTHRIQVIISDMGVTFLIHFANLLVLLAYMRILGVDFGDKYGIIILICALGSIVGCSFGMFVGSIGRMKEGTKIGILIGISMSMSFFAGLMFANMKNIVDTSMPWLNRINPAALISDSFYCISVYDSPGRLAQNLIILGVFAVVLVSLSFIMVRREQYDSI